MPSPIVKLDGLYFEWSSIVDAPVCGGMSLDEFTEYYRDERWGAALAGAALAPLCVALLPLLLAAALVGLAIWGVVVVTVAVVRAPQAFAEALSTKPKGPLAGAQGPGVNRGSNEQQG